MKGTSRAALAVGLAVWAGGMLLPAASRGLLQIQKQARDAGVDVKNCQHCHLDKLPRKEAHAFNDVGKWLVAEKERRKAPAVDGAWLKGYRPGKKK
jgi:hypothetical protein